MKIKIDSREIDVSNSDHNIVQIADANGISIPAPCFRQQMQQGCCKGCAIMVDGVLDYACGVKPKEGMQILIDTPELKTLRAKNINAYIESTEHGDNSSCGCDCSCNSDCGDSDSPCC